MDKSVRGVVFVIGLILLIVIMYWTEISNNEPVLIAVLSAAGALLGAAIGGWYSYQAGIRSATENYELNCKLLKFTSQRALYLLLKFSLDKLSTWQSLLKDKSKNVSTIFYKSECFVYDKNWSEHLAVVDCLTIEEKETILFWISFLVQIDSIAVNEQITPEKFNDIWGAGKGGMISDVMKIKDKLYVQ
ncbi:hypothetical protein [uncultured Anaeromusa sp.]|uniref:hypothetical protein n=1 Tax=uncultured Anaeromusa sp. TaxID=673273 RepID=UPI0029C7242A|nr:hypothetical protein [uncultured Anaeromusa sp.]